MDQKNKKQIIIFGAVIALLIVIIAVVFIVASLPKKGENGDNAPFDLALTFGDDPRTQKNFSWFTKAECEAVVQYYISDAEPGSAFDQSRAASAKGFTDAFETSYPKEGEENSASGKLEQVTLYRHGVYLDGLEPGATYLYRVGDGKNWSASHTFTTAPGGTLSDTGGFSFIIVADTQGFVKSDYEFWAAAFRKASEQYETPAFMVHLGDFTENQDNALLWESYFTLASGLADLTTVPVAGNKDDEVFLDYFLLGTQGGVTGLNGYYSFDYMNVHFSVLNTGDGSKDLSKSQIKWLTKDLSSDGARGAAHRIVLVHKAPYSDRNHADDSEITEIRAQLLPLFEEYGVDVVLEGHDHYYFRSEPATGGGLVKVDYSTSVKTIKGEEVTAFKLSGEDGENGSGVFYFMPGASGVKQHNKGFRDMPEILTAVSELMSGPTFCICDVDESGIYFRTYCVDRYRNAVALVEGWGIEK